MRLLSDVFSLINAIQTMVSSPKLQGPRKGERANYFSLYQIFPHVTCKVVRHFGWVSPFIGRVHLGPPVPDTWCPQTPAQHTSHNQTPGGVKLLVKLKFIKLVIEVRHLAITQRKKTHHFQMLTLSKLRIQNSKKYNYKKHITYQLLKLK